MTGIGLRTNAIWSIIGTGAHQLSSLIIMLAISRLLGTEALGNFSYAIAICSPIIAFSTLGLRNFQVIESNKRFCNSDFRRVQFISSGIAIFSILILACLSRRSGEAFTAIIVVSVSQAVSSQMDTLFAYFQKRRRMDIVARCRLVNAAATLPTCLMAAYFTRSLVAAVFAMLVLRFLSFYLHVQAWFKSLAPAEILQKADLARVKNLAFSSIPIAAMTGVITLEISLPSLALDYVAGPSVLGQFMVVSTICLPVTFILGNLLQASLPYLSGDGASNIKIAKTLVICLGLLTLGGFLVVSFLGTQLLSIFLGEAYVPIESQLILAFAVGFVSLVASILNYSLLAQREYRSCLAYSSSSCIVTCVCCCYFVPHWFLTGAVLSPLLGRILCIILTSISLSRLQREGSRLTNEKLEIEES